MKEIYWTYLVLGLYTAVLFYIGFYAYRRSRGNLDGYMLGSRDLSPLTTALSAGASDMSGWLLMGVPGSILVGGISGLWIAVGLCLGMFCNYLFVGARLRVYTQLAKNAITIPDFLENRFHDTKHVLRTVSGFVILLFFTLYTAAGIVGGGVLFSSVFHVSYHFGLFLTIGIVVVYTYLGGFLAVSLADLIQGGIMFFALIVVPVTVLFDVGVSETFTTILEVNPALLDFFKGTSVVSIVGLLAWGLGYFGQPHIIVRFMAIRHHKGLASARNIGMSWMIVTLLGAAATGLFAVAYLQKTGQTLDNPETIFIVLSQVLFHPFIGGVLLSAMLAAIMSTVAAQLLVTSGTLTKDFYHLVRSQFATKSINDKELMIVSRLSVLAVAVIASSLAWDKSDTILNLVGHAWAGFGSSFSPVILLSLFWSRFTAKGALAGMVAGATTVVVWVNMKGFNTGLYEMIPGFFACSICAIIVSLLDHKPHESIIREFSQMRKHLHSSDLQTQEGA